MSEIELIKQYVNLDNNEIISILTENNIEIKNTKRYKDEDLARLFSIENYGKIDEVLNNTLGLGWIRLKLANDGIDFSDETLVRPFLRTLSAYLGEGVVNTLLSIGITYTSKWSQVSPRELTEELIQQIRDEITAEQNRLISSAFINDIIGRVLLPMSNSGKSISEIKEALKEELSR